MSETTIKTETSANPASSSSSSELNQSLASAAQASFEKGDYGPALKALKELEPSKSSDLKLAHNIALTEYHMKNKGEDFQKTLLNLYSQASAEGDVDKACLIYNLALLQYWRRNYHVALKMLTKIYALVDQLEEQLSLAICFLLAEVNLRITEPMEALQIVQFIETSLLGRGAKLGSSLTLEQKEKSPRAGDEGQLPDVLRIRLQKLKIRAYLTTNRIDQAEVEYSALETLASDEPYTLLLRARLDTAQGRVSHNPSVVHNTTAVSDTENECWTAIHTAMLARKYYWQKKPHLAALHFKKAWQHYENHTSSSKSTKGDSVSLAAWSHSYESSILRGLGLSLLQCKQAAHAFDALLAVVQRESALKPIGQAKLWLRLAECCIVNRPEEDQFKPIQVVGSGLLRTARIPVQKPYIESGDHAAIPVPTLEFGALCLKNAEILLGRVEDSSSVADVHHTILCNQAYIALCLGDLFFALEKARLLLSQAQLSHVHKLLGHMYAAEALLLLNRVEEAQAYLDVPLDFLLDNGGNSGPVHFPALLVWKYNLACVLAARRNYRGALELIIQVTEGCNIQKLPCQVNALAVFLQLKLGQVDQARHLLQMQCAQLR